jgi:hypothetical protein
VLAKGSAHNELVEVLLETEANTSVARSKGFEEDTKEDWAPVSSKGFEKALTDEGRGASVGASNGFTVETAENATESKTFEIVQAQEQTIKYKNRDKSKKHLAGHRKDFDTWTTMMLTEQLRKD